jgi:internalin A
MNDARGYRLERGRYGSQLVLTGPWEPRLADVMTRDGIAELYLNRELGWRGADLGFLEGLSWLRGFKILDMVIKDVGPVHHLAQLRALEISTYCKTPIDFSRFPSLECAALEWRPGSQSLFDTRTLTELWLNRYPHPRSDPFSALTGLTRLAVANSRLHEIRALRQLSRLTSLSLWNLRVLQSLAGLETLTGLQEFDLQGCRKIKRIDELAALPKLQRVSLSENGSIESLAPLQNAINLEEFFFYGSTTVDDGDLSILTRLPALKKTSFRNRRHYSHRREHLAAFQA